MSEAVFERRDPGAIRSAALSLLVHLALVGVLVFGVRWRSSQPEPVMAELWSQLPAVEAPRPPPAAVPKPELPPPPAAEPKPEPKPDIALEEARRRKEELEKKQREEEAQRRKREEELKAKAEAERKEQALAEQRRREEQAAEQRRIQEQLAKALASAPKAPAGASSAAADPAALATWQQQIVGKVRANIVLPPDLAGNPEAQFDVTLLPTGEVLSVKLVRSSGNRVLDDAWERAIWKSSPLPKPAQVELFRRDLRLVFRPHAQ